MQSADDLDRAVDSVVAALSPGTGRDWQAPAGSLEWPCRFTAEHAAHCLHTYAMQLASRTPAHYVSFFSRALKVSTNAQVLELLEASGRLLSAVVRAAKPTDRGFHPFGSADAEGTAGMGCIELLVHGSDIAAGLGLPFEPPPDVSAWILAIASLRVAVRGRTSSTPVIETTRSTMGAVPSCRTALRPRSFAAA